VTNHEETVSFCVLFVRTCSCWWLHTCRHSAVWSVVINRLLRERSLSYTDWRQLYLQYSAACYNTHQLVAQFTVSLMMSCLFRWLIGRTICSLSSLTLWNHRPINSYM